MNDHNAQHRENHVVDVTLDMDALDMLKELMEDKLSGILARYLETAKGYLKSIHDALKEGKFPAVAKAAHPLKSSSEQIGATKVGALAMEIELSAAGSPDITKLKMLATQLEQALSETTQSLAPYL